MPNPPSLLPTEREIRSRIVQTACQATATVRERRLRDVDLIRETYRSLGITTMTPEDSLAALQELRGHVSGVAEGASGFSGREYMTWNDHNVPESESHYSQWLLRQVVGCATRYEPEIQRAVEDSGDSSRTLERIFQVAATDSFFLDPFAEGPAGLSGYEAKMLLFYGLPLERRRDLIVDLELRFDLRDVAPREELERYSARFQDSPYGCSILMDGYFYGALRSNAKSLLHGLTGALGVGIDCSTFVQEVYESAGFPASAFKSPISTASMIEGEMSGLRDGTFEVVRLRSESELSPGDAILLPGHVQIFLGVDNLGRLRVAEALGRRFKTVRESILPLREGPGAGTSVFENPDRPMHVFRPVPRDA